MGRSGGINILVAFFSGCGWLTFAQFWLLFRVDCNPILATLVRFSHPELGLVCCFYSGDRDPVLLVALQFQHPNLDRFKPLLAFPFVGFNYFFWLGGYIWLILPFILF